MKAAIYSRKSKFTEEGESIENQINMCIHYLKNILNIDEYEIFEDEGFSGGNTNRPKFQKLMKEIKSKKFTHLICYRLDRISRNVADFTGTLEILNKNGVSFISIKEQFDTSTAMGRAMMNVSATFAQLERETIAERIKDNLRELSKTGRWLGGPAPLGYESIEVENNDQQGKNRKKHILQINENEINIPKIVFELFLQHRSFQKVSRLLESQGIYSRKGSVFSRELVKQTINNPVYCIADKKLMDYFKNTGCEIYGMQNINGTNGIMPYNRRKENGSFNSIDNWLISVGEHSGIISSDVWIKCQQINKLIKEKASNRQCTSQDALLSGLVVCAKCNSGMAPRQHKNGKYHYRYYSCNLRNKAADRCDNDSLNAYDAEDYVVKRLKALTPNEVIEKYKELQKKQYVKMDNENIINEHLKEIESNKKAISNLVMKMVYLENDMDILEPIKLEIKRLKDRNVELENLIEKLKSQNVEIIDTFESLDEILTRLDNFHKFYDYIELFEEKQALIRSLVKFITWDSETRKIDIILVGSDKNRTQSACPPLSDSSRRNGPCRNNCYNGISTYGKRNYRRDKKSRTCWALC
ncbi:recombinase family protein [Clostridium beijerinckii]|jgi:Site-specific recombinases, DNA invertase Pin homologs|uniref:recombinase family protein n=1 Tax=Clostridium beijerinckii TaxID=1520 RepID=UPI001360DB5F|nr:recombinase family protein [Clostridium beijerinckii]MZK53141.1 recombinase family protein [Clostridium beijerinckii]MZK61221.1 recombinase family protein [Clostridium beijerinckii]MZK71420.1 recombinase family protein [Clostridium beijerinckii]MZK76808.1 recombinase family protein [Clostridium beijerinckii]MZK86487.1 recombinase family protein [Clostridium beijerinckii]